MSRPSLSEPGAVSPESETLPPDVYHTVHGGRKNVIMASRRNEPLSKIIRRHPEPDLGGNCSKATSSGIGLSSDRLDSFSASTEDGPVGGLVRPWALGGSAASAAANNDESLSLIKKRPCFH